MQIDFSPLIPAINGLIQAGAGVLALATPVLVGYAISWLRKHGIAADQQTQAILVSRINATIDNGLRYATVKVDDNLNRLDVQVSDPKIATAVNYVIAQSPDMLKKVGIDPATPEGQATLVRLVTAKSIPPVMPTVSADIHVDDQTAKTN